MEGPGNVRDRFRAIQGVAWKVCAVAGLISAVGFFTDRDQFYRSYLIGYLFCIGFPLGSLAIVMLHHLTGGSWGMAIRRLLEASIRTLPWMAVLFLPIVFGMESLYVWSLPEVVANDPVLQDKELYLNVPFFLARAVVFFIVWITLGWVLGRIVRHQDRTGNSSTAHHLRAVSGPGLGLYALTVTFASVDWAMSIEPHWFSTIYGLMFIVGQGLSTLALAVVVAAFLARREPFSRWLEAQHFHDLGNLMLAFVMLWAYVALSQFLIIWSGNMAEETPWYLHRIGHGWQTIALVLVVFHFAVPFMLLLLRRTKREPRLLARLAVVIIVLRLVDLFWLIAPAFHREGLHVSWLDVTVPVALGGLWVALFIQCLKGRPLISLQDASLEGRLEQAPTS